MKPLLSFLFVLALTLGLSGQTTRPRWIVSGNGTNLVLHLPATAQTNNASAKIFLRSARIICPAACVITERIRTATPVGGTAVTPVSLNGWLTPRGLAMRNATNSGTGTVVYTVSSPGELNLDLSGMEIGNLQGFALVSSVAADISIIYEEQGN